MDGIDLSGGTFRTTLLSYNNELLTSSVKFPGGDSVLQSFTSVHGESKVTSPAGYHAYVYRSYQLDTLGRVARMADSIFKGSEYDRAYAFNSSGRLAGVTFGTTSSCGFNSDYGWVCTTSSDSSHGYSYDLNGNRTDGSAGYTAGTNRITTFHGCSYSLDNDGNVASRTYSAAPCPPSSATLYWSAENRLDSALVAGMMTRYAYDAFGRLVKWSDPGSNDAGTRYFLWDGDHVFAEVDSATGGPGGRVLLVSRRGSGACDHDRDRRHAILRPPGPIGQRDRADRLGRRDPALLWLGGLGQQSALDRDRFPTVRGQGPGPVQRRDDGQHQPRSLLHAEPVVRAAYRAVPERGPDRVSGGG